LKETTKKGGSEQQILYPGGKKKATKRQKSLKNRAKVEGRNEKTQDKGDVPE